MELICSKNFNNIKKIQYDDGTPYLISIKHEKNQFKIKVYIIHIHNDKIYLIKMTNTPLYISYMNYYFYSVVKIQCGYILIRAGNCIYKYDINGNKKEKECLYEHNNLINDFIMLNNELIINSGGFIISVNKNKKIQLEEKSDLLKLNENNFVLYNNIIYDSDLNVVRNIQETYEQNLLNINKDSYLYTTVFTLTQSVVRIIKPKKYEISDFVIEYDECSGYFYFICEDFISICDNEKELCRIDNIMLSYVNSDNYTYCGIIVVESKIYAIFDKTLYVFKIK